METVYFELVKAGSRTIKQVPINLVVAVKAMLDAAGIKY